MKKIILFQFIALVLISSCATNKQANSSHHEQPPNILSSGTKDGRGIPNGRSDSDGPYFRTFALEKSQDPEYGRSAEKPIKTAPRNVNGHIWLLNSLRGPAGEPIEYERRGSCCFFEDKALEFGGGLLDVYEIKIDGSKNIILLYVDMYHKGPPEIPVGFIQRKGQ